MRPAGDRQSQHGGPAVDALAAKSAAGLADKVTQVGNNYEPDVFNGDLGVFLFETAVLFCYRINR